MGEELRRKMDLGDEDDEDDDDEEADEEPEEGAVLWEEDPPQPKKGIFALDFMKRGAVCGQYQAWLILVVSGEASS